ncbi:MAG: adenylate/guanylate cyclase domain-containing protein [Sulfuritalea sp.]|nr:adenylate/guanylate cyclase domain-containing protein [Sulfuritalea sp.]
MSAVLKTSGLRRDLWLLLGFSATAVALQLTGAFAPFERPVRDAGFQLLRASGPLPIANDLVLVAVDEAFLESTPEPLTLIHPYLGRVMTGLAQVKPSVVGLDLVLPSKSYRDMQSSRVKDYDLALLTGLHALAKVSPIVLSETWDGLQGRFRPIFPSFVTIARRSSKGDPTASPVVCEDPDDIVRSYPGGKCQPTTAAVPQAARMAAQLGNAQDWSGEINFALGAPMTLVSIVDVLQWVDSGATEKIRATFGGRAVLIGGAFSFEDRHTLPVALSAAEPGERKIPGLFLQAQIWRSLMNGGLVASLPAPLQAAFVASGALALQGRTGLRKLLLWLAAIAAMAGVALFCLGAMTLILPWGGWTATVLAAVLLRGLIDLTTMLRSRREVADAFSGYVGPQVLRAIERGELKPDLGGELRKVCVVYADIRGFDRVSAVLAPDQLVRLVNRYFAVVSPAIQEAGGMIDKYLGDGLMAVFGAPQKLDDPVRHALEAAQEMLLGVQTLNRDLATEGIPPLQVGIGVHYGNVIVGHLGTTERHEYTAVGMTVNATSRIEVFSKQFPYPVIVSAAVVAAMTGRATFADIGVQEVSGMETMQLYGWKPTALEPLQGARHVPGAGSRG